MVKTEITSNNYMSTGEPELCPMCINGYLRPIGKASTTGESDEPFTPTVHIRDLECDNCGHRQKAASLTEQVSICFFQFRMRYNKNELTNRNNAITI